MHTHSDREYLRRQRQFRRAIFLVAACQLAFLIAYSLDLLSPKASVGGIGGIIVASGLLFTLGVRWVQAVQPPVALTPAEAAATAIARGSFVKRHGMLGFGVLWGTWMAATDTWDAIPDHTVAGLLTLGVLRRLALALIFWLPAGLLTGYVWGRMMWRLFTPRTQSRAE